jgi:hypothetical protein
MQLSFSGKPFHKNYIKMCLTDLTPLIRYVLGSSETPPEGDKGGMSNAFKNQVFKNLSLKPFSK